MPGTVYDEREVVLRPDEYGLFYTDGLVEAHNPAREMFGFPRLKTLMQQEAGPQVMIEFLLDELQQFTRMAGNRRMM
ncbi:MAG TPA: SpoIIE family protein phosphatase [Anaerolineales bacterium]